MWRKQCNDIGQLLLLIPDQMPTRSAHRYPVVFYENLSTLLPRNRIDRDPKRSTAASKITAHVARHTDAYTIACTRHVLYILICMYFNYERIELDYFKNITIR